MQKINTVDDASGIAGLDDQWKIVARAPLGAMADWEWCGSLSDGREQKTFRAMAFRVEPDISVVTGRDFTGRIVLYARLFPASGRLRRFG